MVAFVISVFAFTQTKTEMKPSDISKPVTDYIAKNFAGYSIGKVFKCVSKGTLTSEVMVVKGTDKQTLIFDKDGKFLKKEAVKAEPVPPVKAPVKSLTPAKEDPKKK